MSRRRTFVVAVALGALSAFAAPEAVSGPAGRAAGAADELRFFANSGRSVICRYSSFSGFQLLKCSDRRVKGEDGSPFTLQLKRTGRAEQLVFDSRPIEKVGGPTARFARPGFVCVLTKAQVRCTNAAHHGFVLKLPKASRF